MRKTSLSFSFQATPKRGPKLLKSVVLLPTNRFVPVQTSQSPANTNAPGKPSAPGFGKLGSMTECWSLTSVSGVKMSQRTPRFRVTLGRTL